MYDILFFHIAASLRSADFLHPVLYSVCCPSPWVLGSQEDQKAIYYVSADSRVSAEMSPALEKATALG